ncbi:Auxin-induced protein 5NG4 [Hordeum vulgare]|nr:Auxin-induced protein 5NG4 [Hordeum vulgare]
MNYYTGMTYRVSRTVPEMLYPPQVQVENTLRVWAISRWRGARALTEFFLSAGYRHLPRGSPMMFHVEELTNNGYPIGLIVRFTNSVDAYNLLGRVFWCGCEFIAFTTYNIFTDLDSIFPNGNMHTLPYRTDGDDE